MKATPDLTKLLGQVCKCWAVVPPSLYQSHLIRRNVRASPHPKTLILVTSHLPHSLSALYRLGQTQSAVYCLSHLFMIVYDIGLTAVDKHLSWTLWWCVTWNVSPDQSVVGDELCLIIFTGRFWFSAFIPCTVTKLIFTVDKSLSRYFSYGKPKLIIV